ncbi:MAG: hypothetical protein H6807_14075 [Planctomycetes bacterium]|nr:hypothetical protein [Planctomycetota bacterium]
MTGQNANLGNRLTQTDITNGSMNLKQIRREGRRIFTTPFNKVDGHGVTYDVNNPDHTDFTNRPTLQNNGTFLRINGLDAQTCLECHGVVSNSSIPAELGIGGVAGAAGNAIFQPKNIDVDDSSNNGFADFDGRFINPPFLFGAGGIEAVGKEMTTDLQALKQQAFLNPNTVVSLDTKGINFGSISYDGSNFDYSNVAGIDQDLVVRPFGRKGEFFTTRDFDRGAMQFHFGMQPEEVVGSGVDGDNDGVVDEITIGELSALHVFANLQPKPEIKPRPGSGYGMVLFDQIGCTECHRPVLTADSKYHTFSFPDVPTDPSQNVYLTANLRTSPMNFSPTPGGGVALFPFADLKRHDMGPGLTESFGGALDAQFTTARLWGIADTAPYLHDGRALSLAEAIDAHGGEAAQARTNFTNLSNSQQLAVLALLRSLRTPRNPNMDLGPFQQNVNN